MYDPMTVAFEIKSPFKDKHGFRPSIVTIWHVDPEIRGDDDSCGFSRPKITKEDKAYIKKVAADQYHDFYARREAIREGKDYAYICYNQDTFGAIYWLWRHFARGKQRWQYGRHLPNAEFQYVYQLATNPVDNFQSYKNNNLKEFEEFVWLVYRAFKSYHRPWWKHPKWHIHHWKIQFRPWQRFKRRYLEKCCECGKRGFKGSAYSDWDGTKIWCEACNEKTYTNSVKTLE